MWPGSGRSLSPGIYHLLHVYILVIDAEQPSVSHECLSKILCSYIQKLLRHVIENVKHLSYSWSLDKKVVEP